LTLNSSPVEAIITSRYAPRSEKAAKIIAVLRNYVSKSNAGDAALSDFVCLDLGCGEGTIGRELARRTKFAVCVDIDGERVRYAANQKTDNNVFAQVDREGKLAMADAVFDVVICAQVYEHTLRQDLLAAEIWRVLRPGGICFFSGPNRLALIEEHYWLPFLSWLPQTWADSYVRLFNRHSHYDIKPMHYWQAKQLFEKFTIIDYNASLLRFPTQYHMNSHLRLFGWLSQMPDTFLQSLLPLLPNFNWILVKPK
jgi:2-polyprenyl-3-methyl-5-hydroxy-6-metoxy-1,4-benzoquinol methylase